MSQVIRAAVPYPLWDEHRGVIAIPASYSDEQASAAMLELIRERLHCCPPTHAAPDAHQAADVG